MFRFSLICLSLVGATSVTDSVSEVVSVLQQMLDKSKEEMSSDREVYAKFKCFCDTTTAAKKESISNAELNMENLISEIENRRAENQKLSMEADQLDKDIAANAEAATQATNMRGEENTAFEAAKTEAETGIAQLESAITILSAVGADQTVTGDAQSERLLAADATDAAKGVIAANAEGAFLAKKNTLNLLSEDMKAALRAASVFVHGDKHRAMKAFLQGPQNADYNSQSGEIVGIVKNMLDTFKANLKSDTATEAKKLSEYETMSANKLAEKTKMETLSAAHKETIGENSLAISTAQSDHDEADGVHTTDTEFLAALTQRCADKKAEFEKRNGLRAGEDAAIAQAIATLNSDAAFATFDQGGVQTSFVQLEQSQHKVVRGKVLQSLLSTGRATHSMRLARIAAVLTAGASPFEKVVEMIENTKKQIVEEGEADTKKIETCDTEQTQGGEDKAAQEGEIDRLTGEIAELNTAIGVAEQNIKDSKADIATDEAAQDQLVSDRAAANALFRKELKNCKGMQKILDEAIKVLDHYYNHILASHNKEKVYTPHAGEDSGGGNLKRMEGASVEEMEDECSKLPECAGFNSAGWLKSTIQPSEQWYEWEDGTLYVKSLAFLQVKASADPATWEDEQGMSGQSEAGAGVIGMLRNIETTAKDQDTELNRVEDADVAAFDTSNGLLEGSMQQLNEALTGYELELANKQTAKRQATDDLNGTNEANKATIAALAAIEPGCTFMQENVDKRVTNREKETEELNNSIDLLKGTPLAAR